MEAGEALLTAFFVLFQLVVQPLLGQIFCLWVLISVCAVYSKMGPLCYFPQTQATL